jgi:hypothetical protein
LNEPIKHVKESPFTRKDRIRFRRDGLSEESALNHIASYRRGQIYTRLERPCILGNGILALSRAEKASLSARYAEAAAQGRVTQFVPASGAATRMFKSLLAVLNRPDCPSLSVLIEEASHGGVEAKEFVQWFRNLDAFAYRDKLAEILARDGLELRTLWGSGNYRPILEYLLKGEKLGYAGKPKALIPFHRLADSTRTPLEEHLADATALIRDKHGKCKIHITVSPEHEEEVLASLKNVRGEFEKHGTRFKIDISLQKTATNTLAANLENQPLRDKDDNLVFRPGGHGALLENLFQTKGDIVFIRNIDNVLPERLKDKALAFRKAMGGLLAQLQEEIFDYLRRLQKKPDIRLLQEATRFAANTLGIKPVEPVSNSAKSRMTCAYLLENLDRPLRVCAVVKNQGEPGGLPFWVRHNDGALRPQIVESAQIDMTSFDQRRIVEASTHFNPVDMVCGLRNYRGKMFQPQDFLDKDGYSITSKSKEGENILALELPGLWNGGMAYWNTVFVEAPLVIFNPAKTVIDLLRRGHRL